VKTGDDSRFEQLLEHARDAAFVLDPMEDRFLAANPAACAMLGYSLEELLATPVSTIHRGELPQLLDVVTRVLRDGYGSTVTLTCRARSGRRLPTEMMFRAFRRDGRVCVLALARDRSEHRGREHGD
jgi:formate hydrogenlyase transcriptional activator